MCTESHALDALGIAHEHAFCSETWEPAIRCIRAMAKRPKTLYRDVTEREADRAPDVDLYVCGFPCQPNSVMNLHREQGEEDTRRDPMAKALEYIKNKRPKYWVLENVTGIMHVGKGAVWRALVDALDALEGYAWDYRVLDPCKHANSPQSRPRVYLVGKRDSTTPIEWPRSSIDDFDHPRPLLTTLTTTLDHPRPPSTTLTTFDHSTANKLLRTA